MADLTVSGVRAGFGDTTVLDGLDLAVPAGTIAAVLGPSGCGKTTLLRVIAGLHHVQAGHVRIEDRTIAGPGVHVRPERRGIGIVPQEGALFPHLSVAGNIAFGLGPMRTARARVAELLGLTGLADMGDRMPQELSGGQQQRVALARALAPQPRIILLDEPFSSLDAGLRTELREDVARVLRASTATALLVTHDQQEAMSMADQVAVLLHGTVAQTGTPREVYAQPVDLDVAALLGDVVVADPRGHCSGFPLCGIGVPCVAPDEPDPAAPDRDIRVAVLRPEQLVVTPADATSSNATVRTVHFYGHEATVLLEPVRGAQDATVLSDGGLLRARVPGDTTLRRDDPVRVDVDGAARLLGGATVPGWLPQARHAQAPADVPSAADATLDDGARGHAADVAAPATWRTEVGGEPLTSSGPDRRRRP